jgi:hypothetical protein
MKDYYQILGVQYSAHAADIKRAYRMLAVRYHPDKNPDPQAEVLFKEINEAYDVLSDPQKKTQYDLRRQNPFVEVGYEQPSTPTPPRHRDPAYRRKRPPVYQKSERQRMRELMQNYLPYVKWLCWAALVVTILFALDYILPYQTKQEKIVKGYNVTGRRGGYSHTVLIMESGKKIKLYGLDGGSIEVGNVLEYKETLIYRTVMSIVNGDYSRSLGYVYGGIALFPGILFVVALTGILRRKDVEYHFNACIVSGILLIINLYLIL